MNKPPISPPASGSPSPQQRDNRLAALDQYLAPHGRLTRLMYRATRVRAPWFKRWQITWFIRRYGVDMSIAAQPDLEAYPDFNTFFTRALRPEARPLPADPDAVACPVDGAVSQAGAITHDRLYQAKGHDFTLQTLLGGGEHAASFESGVFATLYLSPKDYHRVHMPLAGQLREMVYVPGQLFSVSPRTVETIPGLFARNERLVMLFDTAAGPLALIMVGAMFVAGMETVWSGLVSVDHRDSPRRWDYSKRSAPLRFARGEEIGRFNMGSTVILLFPAGCAELAPTILPGAPVQMGQHFASLIAGTQRAIQR